MPAGRPARRRSPLPEPDEVNARLLDVCAAYAGSPGITAGRRTTWTCPQCSKSKLEALPERAMAGCWNAACPVPQTTDALGIVAFFEGLDRHREFPELLRCAGGLLGLDPSRKGERGADPRRNRITVPLSRQAPHPPVSPPDPDLLDAVYTGLLARCPLAARDRAFWASRGVIRETVRRGRFASATPARVRAAIGRLVEEFGREGLLEVPGFFENARGRLSFTLLGDYQLIPYHDRLGRVTTIEGRATEPQRLRLARAGIKAKYVSLRSSGNHLYLFPSLAFDGIEAFTEGSVGAIVAAQEGLTVAAISGVRKYRSPDGSPLPELRGADLSGRTVPFIPDADDPPNPDVLDAAPKAALALAVPARGRPALAYLPRGLDLDDWLLSLPEHARPRAFEALLSRAERRPLPRGRHPPP